MENFPNFFLEPTIPFTNHLPPIIQAQTAAEIIHQVVSGIELGPNGENEKKIDGSSTWYNRNPWTKSEDRKLICLVEQYHEGQWNLIAKEMPKRNGKQCRERWRNHLQPNIKKSGVWTGEEEGILISQHERIGNRWSEITKYLPGRSENAVKNHFNCTKRKLHSTKRINRHGDVVQSTLLEEYIRKIISKNGSASGSSSTNATMSPPHTIPIAYNNLMENVNNHGGIKASLDDDDSISYLTSDTYDEEMNFISNLLPSNGSEINVPYFNIRGGIFGMDQDSSTPH